MRHHSARPPQSARSRRGRAVTAVRPQRARAEAIKASIIGSLELGSEAGNARRNQRDRVS